MELIVDDTNILIDLANTGLAPYCRNMGVTFHTTELVIKELKDQSLFVSIQPLLLDGTLVQDHLEGLALVDFAVLYQEYHTSSNLTPADCSVIVLAETLHCRLLTNDQKLLRHARQRGIETNGLLWLTDRMVDQGIVNPMQMINCLQQLMISNDRAPRQLILERIDQYLETIKNNINFNNREL